MWTRLIFVTSKGSDVRVASMVKVRVKKSTRARKNPEANFAFSALFLSLPTCQGG